MINAVTIDQGHLETNGLDMQQENNSLKSKHKSIIDTVHSVENLNSSMGIKTGSIEMGNSQANELAILLDKVSKNQPSSFILADICNYSVSKGIVLSRLLYWSDKMDHQEFYKADVELAEECKMEIPHFKLVKKDLIDMGFIEVKIEKNLSRTCYKINYENIMEEIQNLDLIDNKQKNNKSKLHFFNEDHAVDFGFPISIMLSKFVIDTILSHRDNGIHFHEGRTWCCTTFIDLTIIFPYWSTKQIRNIFDKLVERNILIKGNFNKNKLSKTSWYAFVDEAKFLGSNIKQEGQK